MKRQRKSPSPPPARILVVDEEEQFRHAIARQLGGRGYEVIDVNTGEDAIKVVRHDDPEVVILGHEMPGLDGIQTLREIKRFCPEAQVIFLTGEGSTEVARITGKHDVFAYLDKPIGIDGLVEVVERAREERRYARAREEIPEPRRSSVGEWLIGSHNMRPGFIILGLSILIGIALMPDSDRLLELLTTPKTGEVGEALAGYSDYRRMAEGQTITAHYSHYTGHDKVADGGEPIPMSVGEAAFHARIAVAILIIAALFWATAAIPPGMTALLVGALLYLFDVLPPDMVAKSFAKDSVVFIFGVLAVSAAIAKTGLDRRIGVLLLGTGKTLPRFIFFFAPLLSITAAFLSEHILVAFLGPLLVLVYMSAIQAAGLQRDRSLIVMMLLLLTFCGNVGGPGSPAAGGRNAVMLGILADYNQTVSFGEWIQLGLPFVPVMAVTIALYFYFMFRRRIQVPELDVAAQIKRESEKIGPMTRDEYKAAAILVLLVVLWVTQSDKLGMGGPALICIVLFNVTGIIRWKDINAIHWDVIALYAAASAMGYALATTGAALWLASGFVELIPAGFKTGAGLLFSSSLVTGVLTNFMSDAAAVAALGPITVPMATLSGGSPVAVGLATAFASSFAHMLIIGTPNNAIVYGLARDPETGEQLVTMRDFLIHGGAVWLLSMLVLWGWVFLGYWRWMGV